MNRDKKAEILGRPRVLPNTGLHLPDKERLFAPLKRDWSVARLFCSGCGQYLEVTGETLSKLMAEMGADEMPNPSDGVALIITACPCCMPEVGYRGATIVHRQ
jgi:hypothetical protein